jgi:hypothetical protein
MELMPRRLQTLDQYLARLVRFFRAGIGNGYNGE